MSPPKPPSSPDPPARISLRLAGLHLFTLTTLVVAQPMFELLSIDPMVLVTHQARPSDIVLFSLFLCSALPCLLWLLEAIAEKIWSPARTGLHLLLVLALLTVIALPVWKRMLLMPGAVLIGLAVLTAVLGMLAYARWAAVRLLVTFASPSVLLVPALFLLRDPIWSLLFPLEALPQQVVSAQQHPPVVMVVFDEFCSQSLLDEHRQIDAVRYPNFAALAEGSTWFRNATTVNENTMYAVPAIVTGSYSDHSRPPTLANYSRNLFTFLGQAGYELTVFEPFTTLCPDDENTQPASATRSEQVSALVGDLGDIYQRYLLPSDMVDMEPPRRVQQILRRQWDRQRQKTSGVMRYDRLTKRREQFEHFIECLRPADQPRLYFLHVLLPHAPYKFLPSGKRHQMGQDMTIGIGGIAGPIGMRSDDELEAMHDQQQYLWQLGCVDHYLGRMVARLKEQGLYDACLLVVVADHGVSFRAGQPARGTTRETYADIMSIPLFIKAPGQTTGNISDRNVESIDVLPSMADLLKIEVPWSTDGSSVYDPAVAERSTKMVDSLSAGKMSFDAAFLDKDRALFQMLGRFGSGNKPGGLYLVGPHPELVGKSLQEVAVLETGKVRIHMEMLPTFANVDRGGVFVPCALAGWLEPLPAQPLELAVSINGTIRAVTRTYITTDKKDSWCANVPEESFVDGANDVRVFVIRTVDSQLKLEPTALDALPR